MFDVATTLAASEVQGVLSVESLALGGALGSAFGGALGLVQGGPLGAAVGASAGAAAGAAAGHALQQHRRRETFSDVSAERVAPDLHVVVTARYGEDLVALADRVRTEVELTLRDTLGLAPGAVTVEVVDVVSPEAEHDGRALGR